MFVEEDEFIVFLFIVVRVVDVVEVEVDMGGFIFINFSIVVVVVMKLLEFDMYVEVDGWGYLCVLDIYVFGFVRGGIEVEVYFGYLVDMVEGGEVVVRVDVVVEVEGFVEMVREVVDGVVVFIIGVGVVVVLSSDDVGCS